MSFVPFSAARNVWQHSHRGKNRLQKLIPPERPKLFQGEFRGTNFPVFFSPGSTLRSSPNGVHTYTSEEQYYLCNEMQ